MTILLTPARIGGVGLITAEMGEVHRR